MDNPQSVLKDPLQRLLRLRAGGAVKRYHTFPTLGNQSVGEHSHAVALILLSLHPNPSRNLILAALFHDLAEYDTGDTPANVKWKYPVLLQVLESAEEDINLQLGIYVELDPVEQQWLKFADTLEYCLYSLEQRRLGNQNMDIVFERGMSRLAKHELLNLEPLRKFYSNLRAEYSLSKHGMSPSPVSL